MRMIVPYEKEIIFSTKISEISSISLEFDANLLDNELEGDFLLEGEYKIHEISINKEPFKYRLPFTIELSDKIIRDSIHYDIYNFTYEIVSEDTLKLNIEFLIEGEEIEEIVDEELESTKEDTITESLTQEENIEEPNETIKKQNEEATERNIDNPALLNQEIIEKVKQSVNQEEIDTENIIVEDSNSNNQKIDESIILNHVNDSMNTYIIYHVYVINDTDDLDSVANKFNISKELIKEYNEPLNWVAGEKILIPEIKDE